MSEPGSELRVVGRVGALFRFPFKSMGGESLSGVTITPSGVLGDRAYAFFDEETGRLGSVKHPGKWGGLLECEARFVTEPRPDLEPPPLIVKHRGTGEEIRTDDPAVDATLSRWLGRPGTVSHVPAAQPFLEMDWPDIDGLYRPKNTVSLEGLPPGSFFDVTPLHVLTSSSLAALQAVHPGGRLDLRRFRPNVFLETDEPGLLEREWVGKEIHLGDAVIAHGALECPRCVMTTVAQEDLPRDLDVLRAIASLNGSHLGLYATVVRPGTVRVGDPVRTS